MAKLYNLARVSTATTGTGTITLGAAIGGFLTFALSGVQDGDVVSYGIADGANSEVGTGTYTASGTTLTRNVTRSTNSNAAINLSGSAQIYVTARAEDIMGSVRQQIFTTSGTYTPSAGMLFSIVEAIASGGGAGGASGASGQLYGGGGGAGGQYVRSRLTAAQIGASQPVSIGAAGTGGTGTNNGTTGGDVTLGSSGSFLLVAKGGAGGLYGAAAQVGGGVAGSVSGGIGDFVQAGGSGGFGAYNGAASQPALPSGFGGAAAFGGGSPPPAYTSGTATAGMSGSGRGSGGSGAIVSNTAGTAKGGDGAAGILIITEYCTP